MAKADSFVYIMRIQITNQSKILNARHPRNFSFVMKISSNKFATTLPNGVAKAVKSSDQTHFIYLKKKKFIE